MKLQELVIKDFKGLNTKASPTDSENHQCQSIRDFEISTRTGMLKKGFGYELATDILGANYTAANKLVDHDSGGSGTISSIKNIYEWYRDSSNVEIIAFANDGSEDRIYRWVNASSYWDQLDDNTDIGAYTKARFTTRHDAMIIGSGIAATNYPVFIKYYAARSILGGTTNQAAGYYDYKNTLPFSYNFSMYGALSASGLGSEALRKGIYNYYAALVYDDGQIGSISNRLLSIQTSSDDKGFNIRIRISNTNGDVINRRITHINIYREQILDAEIAKLWALQDWYNSYLLTSIPVDNDTEQLATFVSSYGTVATATNLVSGLNLLTNVAADLYIGCYCELTDSTDPDTVHYKRITDNDTNNLTLANTTSMTDARVYYWRIIPYWWDNGDNYDCYIVDQVDALTTTALTHTNRSVQDVPSYNYKYALHHHNRMIVAPLYSVDDTETHANWVGVSNINGDGNYEYDVITNIINLQDYGVNNITGIGRILDYVLIWTTNDLFKLNLGSGSEFTWSLEETLQNVGLLAPDSLTYIVGDEFKYNGYYYVAKDGFRCYDGYRSILISPPIEDMDNFPVNVTTLSEAIGMYDERLKQWIVSFPTDGTTWKFDLRTAEWLKPVYTDEIDESCKTLDGELLVTDNSSIFVMHNDGTNNLTTYGATDAYIDPYWKSKVYDFGNSRIEKILHEVTITYRSNTEVTFKYYLDRGSANSMNGNPFAAATTMTSKTVGFPIGARGYEAEFEISLTSANKETNTYVEIDEIRIGYTYAKSTRYGA